MLSVVGSAGDLVAGRSEIADGERVWRFVPETSWAPGRYLLLVDPRLEDPSGNSLRGLFDAPQMGAPGEAEGSLGVLPTPFVVATTQDPH